ncbi:MAG TPA: HEPN domain-containing protein [Candidatus Nanoarchaeia archaeon]|nr:HEPN domain-containing protein [Candidatus Nanoarchaeia archaeon]
MDIRSCIEKGFLKKIAPDSQLSVKEMAESQYDLVQAQKTFNDGDFKWSIVKSYYSMFHAAKAVLYSLGYAEKKHIAIAVVLEELNKKGKLELKYTIDFKAALSAREEADYHYAYGKESAEYSIVIAKAFGKKMKEMIL